MKESNLNALILILSVMFQGLLYYALTLFNLKWYFLIPLLVILFWAGLFLGFIWAHDIINEAEEDRLEKVEELKKQITQAEDQISSLKKDIKSYQELVNDYLGNSNCAKPVMEGKK